MLNIGQHVLGTWSFGNDKWWGYQDDRESERVLDLALHLGINSFDTAPAYGRGHSEELMGAFLKKKGLREKVQIMTKFGLRFEGRTVVHDLSNKQLDKEIDLSRKRLNTDYIDVYFAHWPDSNTRVEDLAESLYKYYQKGFIRAVGLSNFSKEDVETFIKHCPLDIIQSPYSMWRRENEYKLFKFAKENDILVSIYSPLERGVLSGKFFKEGANIPKDLNRTYHEQLKVDNFQHNKECIEALTSIARNLKLSLAQLVIAWTKDQACLDSLILGSRNVDQLKENSRAFALELENETLDKIDKILQVRDEK